MEVQFKSPRYFFCLPAVIHIDLVTRLSDEGPAMLGSAYTLGSTDAMTFASLATARTRRIK